ncbi:hypothetical protein BGZ76_000487 [Entomortierella beljakovae]|nr:hypothetical protein BGZ76_000487 [Entomortierella beljakovae]
MSFSVETILDTKIPYVVDLLGPPSSSIHHDLTGTVRLSVQKPTQLKQLFVILNGEANTNIPTIHGARTDAITLCRIEQQLISSPTLYQPGEYSFQLRISIPGNLPTVDPSRLRTDTFLWSYEFVTSCVPSGLFLRRKVIRRPLTLQRVHVPPSETPSIRYGARRLGNFECSLYVPKVISLKDKKIDIQAFLHPFNDTHKIKEIVVQAIQTEKIDYDVEKALRAQARVPAFQQADECPIVKTKDIKNISQVLTIKNPDQEEFCAEWGREHAVESELLLETKYMLPCETLDWLEVSHGVRFTVVFADSSVRPLVVVSPLQIINIIEDVWSTLPVPEGMTPPDYGIEDGSSTLLDSNTSRVSSQQLHAEYYPERELIVPDLVDDLPPVYDYELERHTEASEKQSST